MCASLSRFFVRCIFHTSLHSLSTTLYIYIYHHSVLSLIFGFVQIQYQDQRTFLSFYFFIFLTLIFGMFHDRLAFEYGKKIQEFSIFHGLFALWFLLLSQHKHWCSQVSTLLRKNESSFASHVPFTNVCFYSKHNLNSKYGYVSERRDLVRFSHIRWDDFRHIFEMNEKSPTSCHVSSTTMDFTHTHTHMYSQLQIGGIFLLDHKYHNSTVIQRN